VPQCDWSSSIIYTFYLLLHNISLTLLYLTHIHYISSAITHSTIYHNHIFLRLNKPSNMERVIIILYSRIIIMLCSSILYTLAPCSVVTLTSQPHTFASVLYSDYIHTSFIDSDANKFLALSSYIPNHVYNFI